MNSFSRTLRGIAQPGRSGAPAFALLMASLAACAVWATAARVSIVVVSRHARFDSRRTVRQIAIPASGRIASVNITLGQNVRRGDLLLELDATEVASRRERAVTEANHLRRRIEAVEAQIASMRVLAKAEAQRLDAKLESARENRREREHLAAIGNARADRIEHLGRDGLVAISEMAEARDRSDAEIAGVRALGAAEEQIAKEQIQTAWTTAAGIHELESTRIELEARRAADQATIREAAWQMERLRVRAPDDGSITSFAELRPGVWIAGGTVLGSIAPATPAEVTAYFDLRDMPLIHAGQPAWIWIEASGRGERRRLAAIVNGVERDARGDEFRVTLRLQSFPTPAPDVESGFPAIATIEVQRLSPLGALLRAAGMFPARIRTSS